MSSSYRFQPPTRTSGPGAVLPAGEYSFVVVSCDPPRNNPRSGNLVCALELSIQPDGQKVFANPWAGTDRNGVDHDQIAEFLLAINRAPKPGDEPNWQGCVGAKGKCKLKVEDDLNGDPRNRVAYFHVPKQLGKATSAPTTSSEFEQARAKANPGAGAPDPDLDVAPDDIPF
jgi:hypothetical protein